MDAFMLGGWTPILLIGIAVAIIIFFISRKVSREFKLWIPLLLLVINIILFSLLVEELIDASMPNYGGPFKLLTPVFGSISFFYIEKRQAKMNKFLMWLLQGLNWLFIIFPIAVFMVFWLAFI